MHLPRSPLISDANLYISGNVTIDPSAVIASNVMLQADPGCQLIIAAGASVGTGCVLHAYQGTLEIAQGATLGSGVLVIGKGKIGAYACIGTMATVISSDIAPDYAVPPGAVIGDQSAIGVSPSSNSSQANSAQANSAQANASKTDSFQSNSSPANSSSTNASPADPPSPVEKPAPKSPVYGQVYLERMMVMMFPDRQKLENPSSDE